MPTVRIQRAKQDEQYWKARMRVLQTALDNDRTFLTAAKKRLTDLDRQVHRSVDDVLYVRDGLRRATLDGDYQAAVTESSRYTAAVTKRTRAIGVAEEEAHHANVPPGWLRLP